MSLLPCRRTRSSRALTRVCLVGPSPEGETGPYWIPGERIRSQLREGEPGVPVIVEQQYIDVETCEPVVDLYTEIWGCNATGVYSGLVVEGNGNAADLSNRQRTFLRGCRKLIRMVLSPLTPSSPVIMTV